MTRIKQLCGHAYGASVEEQLDLQASLMAQSQGAPEAIEGIGAFLEKRAPAFAARRRS
jgi:enoyl-CoA hydratase/carnithine racemase